MKLKDEEFIEESKAHDKVEKLDINQKMKQAFINYAMSVIVSRALPDVRDGLKPVQRRILYGMNELHVYANTAYKKSARIVGDVMGKYHPHGDSSIYEAMVRMAQLFSYREPLVDGHGNFGSIDGDGAAAMRYTEARMSKLSQEMLRDIDKGTVNFVDNYDGTESEPSVLPAKFPNFLVNGSIGIAVGMATNIPPHNLSEVCNATIALIDNPDLDTSELMEYIKGPDFPTGATVLGLSGLRKAYETGNGLIQVRAKAEIVDRANSKKKEIIVTEIPYGVNKTKLIEKIADIAKAKIVEGITELRDESNRKGMRIVIELRKDVNAEVMLNNLYKFTQLQTSYGINMIGLVNNSPQLIPLKLSLTEYIKHAVNVITRRTEFDLDKSLARLHILEGYIIAIDNIDRIVHIIRNSLDGTEKEQLMDQFNLSALQAQAILDMQLKRLSGLNKDKTVSEFNDLKALVEDLQDILANDSRKYAIVKEELVNVEQRFGNQRRTEISLHEDLSIENEDLIPVEDIVITVTEKGYSKRMRQDVYKSQSRGGVGVKGIKTNDDDNVKFIFPTSTHDWALFFTNKGRVYKIKGYQIPEGSRQSKGLPIVNILHLDADEEIAAIARLKNGSFKDEDAAEQFLFFTTKNGVVKRTSIDKFQNIRTTGIIAITLDPDDELLSVRVTDGNRDIILGGSNGKAIRFEESQIRVTGRNAAGVRGMRLPEDDKVVGVAVVDEENTDILVVSEKGYGKKTDKNEYRNQNRGGSGVKTVNITEKNGKLLSLKAVNDDEDLLITTDNGTIIRMAIAQINKSGRSTLGVKLIRLRDSDALSTVAIVDHQEEIEEVSENKNENEVESKTEIVELEETK